MSFSSADWQYTNGRRTISPHRLCIYGIRLCPRNLVPCTILLFTTLSRQGLFVCISTASTLRAFSGKTHPWPPSGFLTKLSACMHAHFKFIEWNMFGNDKIDYFIMQICDAFLVHVLVVVLHVYLFISFSYC